MDLRALQERLESNPRLTEALVDVEGDEAERWKTMHAMISKERDAVVRKNATLYVELQEANKKLLSVSAPSAAPAIPMPFSPFNLPPTALCTLPSVPKAKTPSFTTPEVVMGGPPKAPSIMKGFGPPPQQAQAYDGGNAR